MVDQSDEKIAIQDLVMIGIGSALYALALVIFNITNHLADGGISGVTLILRAVFHINPAYSTLIINVPLIWIGYRFLGRRSLIYTIFGTTMLAVFLWIWQRVPIGINLHGDLFLAAVSAGLLGGFGSGLVYRYGGTTGGTDIIARLFERFRGVPMGQTLLYLDIVVLVSSLIYIDIRHMAYTLLCSFIFSRVVNVMLEGAYTARGVLIISNEYQTITDSIMDELERGVTILKGEGGYSHQDRPVLYVVVSPRELHTLRRIIARSDQEAFISVLNVNEAAGEGFSYARPTKKHALF